MFVLYNSYTKKNEEIKIIDNVVSMYVCGPTVYNYIHIGNARPLIVFDTLRRALEFSNIKVNHVSNITDIDDKIIIESQKQNISEKELSEKFTKAFNEDVKKINVLAPHSQPGVLENMDEIIKVIDQLLQNGFAYVAESGDVYFDISKVEDYGTLSNLDLSQIKDNASERLEQTKEGANFVLWKTNTEGIQFDSPWGKGRPGWHTECVAFILSAFNNKEISIHGGGLDLKFPHHTNEIAQGKGLHNHRLAYHWSHNGFVVVDKEKMSKSLGNTILVKDILQEYDYKTVKLLFLSTHYQKPVNFTQQELEQLNKVSRKIQNTLDKIQELNITNKQNKSFEHTQNVLGFLQENLNTANALSELYLAMKNFNKTEDKKEVACDILNITKILGLR